MGTRLTTSSAISSTLPEPDSALTYGTIGPDTASQIAFEMLTLAAKVDITFVPFTGYTPAIQALLAHQVTAAQADLTTLQGRTAIMVGPSTLPSTR
jgi:tripartite-type tricarboxylate transporter receptor subunit TctC